MKEYVVIVAGGSGLRMGSNVPKQFIKIDQKPIILYTIEAFLQYSPKIEIILVLPELEIEQWERIAEKHHFSYEVQTCIGGNSRFQSVKNGLSCIPSGDGWVAIHDGVRPLIKPETIREAFQTAKAKGNAIIVTPLKESIREINQEKTIARDRSKFYLIQTPQIFNVGEIKAAYQTEETSDLTDDASVAENYGLSIHIVEGDYENIKITTPEDLILADALLKDRNKRGI